jgi:hypothetical protein
MMRTTFFAALLASTAVLQAGPAQAQECLTFASGEILCDDGYYFYYWSPSAGDWQLLDREATAAALGIGEETDALPGEQGGSTDFYGGGGSITTTDDGCMMLSAPGYGYGESLSFSSGC